MKKITLQKGISLVETIVYVGIFSIFVVGLVQFSSTLTSSRLNTQTVLEVNEQGSQVVQLITQTLRNGSSITSPTIGNTATSLNIVTNTGVTSPTVFSVSGGVLYITEGSGSPIALTNNKVVLSNLIFSNLSRVGTPSLIKVTFTLSSVSSRYPYTLTFDGSGALRK